MSHPDAHARAHWEALRLEVQQARKDDKREAEKRSPSRD